MIPLTAIFLIIGTVVVSAFLPSEWVIDRNALLNQLVSALCLLGWISETKSKSGSKKRKCALFVMLGFCAWTAVSRPFLELSDKFVRVEAIIFALLVLAALFVGGYYSGTGTSRT